MEKELQLILDKKAVLQKIERIAHEIYEQNFQEKELIFIGIDPTGYHFAKLLLPFFTEISKIKVQLVKLSLDKDAPLQSEITLSEPEEILNNKSIVLFDDVLNTGRTLAYSLKPFLNKEIKKLQTAVVVDRNYPQFPISADFVGYALSTTLQEHVRVILEDEERMGVYLS